MNSTDDELRDAFERFLANAEVTLMPTAFAQWLNENERELFDRLGAEHILAFTQRYFAAPLHVQSNAPPLKRKY